MAQRIYIIGTPDNKVRLVKASTRAQALSHVANTLLTLRIASQDDLVKSLGDGVEVENAKSPDQVEMDI
jgi:hypothetical protein